MVQWTNPLTRASGFDYVFSTSAFQALALKPPTSTSCSSQLWPVGNEKLEVKLSFGIFYSKVAVLRKNPKMIKQNHQENCLLRKCPIMNEICFSLLITDIMEYSDNVVAI